MASEQIHCSSMIREDQYTIISHISIVQYARIIINRISSGVV